MFLTNHHIECFPAIPRPNSYSDQNLTPQMNYKTVEFDRLDLLRPRELGSHLKCAEKRCFQHGVR